MRNITIPLNVELRIGVAAEDMAYTVWFKTRPRVRNLPYRQTDSDSI